MIECVLDLDCAAGAACVEGLCVGAGDAGVVDASVADGGTRARIVLVAQACSDGFSLVSGACEAVAYSWSPGEFGACAGGVAEYG